MLGWRFSSLFILLAKNDKTVERLLEAGKKGKHWLAAILDYLGGPITSSTSTINIPGGNFLT